MQKRLTAGLLLKIIFAISFLFIGLTTDLYSQVDLNASNLSNVRSVDITDEQLKTFLSRAQSQGISIDQAFQLAMTRGLPASEAQQIRNRINNLQDEVAVNQAEDIERLEQQIESETESSEYSESDTTPQTPVFGAQLFRNRGLNLTPSLNIPTPVNYQLGAGDQLVITIWGDRTDQLNLTVSPEGSVNLQNRGPVYVNGLTIEKATERLMGQLAQLYGGLKPSSGQPTTYAEVSLGRVRTISVTVTGEVRGPGTYSVSSLSTVFNALYASGGPNDIGSFRNIRVIRGNEVATELDLYDFLLKGDQTNNIRLRDQDVIQVLPYEARVSIDGQILRPAIYELKGMNTYQDLINMAGGFRDLAYRRQTQIYRMTDTQRRILTLTNERYGEFVLLNGDQITIPEILERFENRIMITGAVWRPGEFELKEGMTLSELIGEADGLRPDAFMSRGLINRVKPDLSFEQLSFSAENVLNNPAQFDIKLQREDEIIIRGIRDLRDEAVVEIDGAVREAGVFVWLENMTLQDLVLKADGFRDAAELSRIEISRRTNDFTQTGRLVETVILSVDSLLNEHEDLLNFKLQPYDYIYVHRRPDFQAQQFVTVEGEVMYPGIYAISSKNERISDIIVRAGGLTAEAYVPGSRITRQLSAIDRLSIDYNFLNDDELEETLGEARQNQEPAMRDEATTRAMLNQEPSMRAEATTRAMLNQEPSIPIGIDLETALSNPSSGENLYVRQGDVIRVPKLAQTVKVTGAVMQEVEVRYVPGANYSYYVNRAGGLNDRALKKRSFVVYANGEVDRNRRFLWMTVSRPEIQPGAEIVIPYKPEGDQLSAQEIVALSSMIISTTTSLLFLIDRINQ